MSLRSLRDRESKEAQEVNKKKLKSSSRTHVYFQYVITNANLALVISLATTFYSPSTSIIRIISATLHILDMRTEYLRKWPSNYHYRIEGGKFANAIGAVDSFPILISFRPKGNANRKRLFYYRERKWAYKVQTFVGYFESSSLFCCGSNTI